MKQILSLAFVALLLFSCDPAAKEELTENAATAEPVISTGTLEVVAEMDINPGNVAVSKDGRVFCTIHPLRPQDVQLVEITGKNSFQPFPSADFQSEKNNTTDEQFDTPLGAVVDNNNRLWVIDVGMNLGKARLFAFDINTGEQLMRFDLPEDIAPPTSFVQDLAVDEQNGWVYLADFGDPGIIAVDINNKTFRKFTHQPSMASEDIDLIINLKPQYFLGELARVGINPITLSADRETIYYGAMNGSKWYRLPAALLRNNKSDAELTKAVAIEGLKPISDGAATDARGNHYFTNLSNGSIDVLDPSGTRSTLVKDDRISWPDNVRFGDENWLYIAVNQLHKTPAFTGGEDEGEAPYYILRVWVSE